MEFGGEGLLNALGGLVDGVLHVIAEPYPGALGRVQEPVVVGRRRRVQIVAGGLSSHPV